MKTYLHPGDAISWLNDTAADIESGERVEISAGFFGVAETRIFVGKIGALSTVGVHRFPSGNAVFAVGDRVSIAGVGPVVANSSGPGTVVRASTVDDDTVDVIVNHGGSSGAAGPPGTVVVLSDVGNVPAPTPANDQQALFWDQATNQYFFKLPDGAEPTVEHLTIATLNTIPDLAAEPSPGTVVTMIKNGLTFYSTAPAPAFSIAGQAVTYNDANAGTDLFPGDLVAISYR